MTRIAIDPISRIEGHLRIEAQVEGGHVKDAWSSSTMFRGMELVLRNRDPRDAWIFAQRICGVCTTVHALAAVRAVEDALQIEIPDNARLMRNIIAGTQYVQDHVIHFYQLHGFDWIDVVSALKADPAATSKLAQSLSPWPKSSTTYFEGIKGKLTSFVTAGQLGFLGNGYWGHPAYKLSPEANLMATAHYLEALEFQRQVIKIQAILGGKNPHPQTYLVGGMAMPVDLDSQVAMNAAKFEQQLQLLNYAKTFVEQVYIPDLLAIGSFYKDWTKYGAGSRNYLTYGDYPVSGSKDPATFMFPRGMLLAGDLDHVHPVDQRQVSEYITHSWYTYEGGDGVAKHPWQGETDIKYTGPQPPFEHLNVDEKYSWVKSPRYDGKPMEVGPLARMLIGYASGRPKIKAAVDKATGALGIHRSDLCSTLGRVVCRGIETDLMADQLLEWHHELVANAGRGDVRIFNKDRWDPSTWPKESQGFGGHEAPRGALGHWVRIKDGTIENYQAVVPTTWNSGPRDPQGQRGPYEASLVGTPVAIEDQPLEILRTVHSFDPCMACAVHVTDPNGGLVVRVETQG